MHLHILFFVQNWNVNVLLINTQEDKFSQLAYDMFVSFSTQSYAVIISPSLLPFLDPPLFWEKLVYLVVSSVLGWLLDTLLQFHTTFSTSSILILRKLYLKR